MNRLKRKIDNYLLEWKNSDWKMPLIVSGARQIGKTNAIEYFGKNNYTSYININFILQPEFSDIFELGYSVDNILKKISMHDPNLKFIPHETLIFFDEMQKCPNVATCLKSFKIDGRYDIICSGSLMGLNYNEIDSNSVGYKINYTMHSLDFEEFLWAKGYKESQIEDLYTSMKNCTPLSNTEMNVMTEHFKDYMVIGGMPAIVSKFIENKNFSGILDMQKQILMDYEEDITKYAGGLDKGKILDVYRKISVFLGKDNKKFQISKVSSGAKSRDYIGVIDWLLNAGIINVSYCLSNMELPLKGNYNPDNYRLYYGDNGLLIGSLDEDSQKDLRNNQNFNTYKGAIYENIIGEMLVKAGYNLYFFKNEKGTIEIDYVVRDINSVIPIEVKASDNKATSLNKVIDDNKYKEIKYGIKFCNKNIGFNGKFYTFPYFMAFFLKRYLSETK